ncbi:MAG: UbiH/UbiF/VisC/COQ6 family ubiquinone biosynthesis hydroxylase [Xanthomonadales bacterium]|nr:UbiH/UbiF/VisC/COQ6 family ubiquinone biosynthesis hydroxylase [Xanthomonadales bacterium]ODU92360.1 MAG: 2-octaprenyl-3-methyl-6-methoxy-1,4-benzoquinol hydroxylase [Rhodanobacter sp. SCN 66-43]OJY85901.1 MAG: 2-octaprenyl-3-methyl-6-methoxy-1,4-benzoquinol hydroxylase [Xanthomonadales bacterium 66-474]
MNARRPALDIAIAGGGMVGAACALALARRGFSVALLEAREPQAWHAGEPEDLRVIALAPSSARLLDGLGVWRGIEAARVSPYAHMRVWDAASGAELAFDATRQGRAQLGWIVENKLVAWTLWNALEAAGVRRVCPAQVESFTQREDRVVLDLAGGEPLSAALLVIADGAGSRLREQAGIAAHGRDYHQRAVVAHVATERAHEATAWQRFTQEGPIALLPLADGRSSIVWSLPEARAREVLALDDAAFCEAAGVASDFRLGRVTTTTPRASFPLRLQVAERFAAGRCVLLGDAAHAVHPLAGQGANIGLRDVAELAGVLGEARDAGRDFTASHILQRYARCRRSAGALDARAFDAVERMFAWQAPGWTALRGLGVRAVDALGPLKRALAAHAAG